jgi:hypothetical protein
VRAFPIADSEELALYARSVADEIFDLLPLDLPYRRNVSVVQVMRELESAIAERHPELSEEAGKALSWMWSYSSGK